MYVRAKLCVDSMCMRIRRVEEEGGVWGSGKIPEQIVYRLSDQVCMTGKAIAIEKMGEG